MKISEVQKTLAEADYLVGEGRSDLAIKVLDFFLAKNPGSKSVQTRLSEVSPMDHDFEAQSPAAEILNHLKILLAAGSANLVEKNTEKLLRFYPKSQELWITLAKAYLALAKLDQAKRAAEVSCQLAPDHKEALETHVTICERMASYEEATSIMMNLIDIEPHDVVNLSRLARNLELLEKFEEAISVYNRLLLIEQNHLPSLLRLGNLYQSRGDFNAAKLIFESLLAFYPGHAGAHRLLGNLKRYSIEDPQIHQMLNIYKRSKKDEESRGQICFALGKAYEDVDDYERAFKFFKEGNQLKKSTTKFDIKKTIKLFSQIRENSPNVKKIFLQIEDPDNSPTPIFVVGMPRSGTTLVEQVLTAHKDVASAGELDLIREMALSVAVNKIETNAESLLAIRKRYLDYLRKIDSGAKYVIDKMPQNFLFIGIIRQLFPEAKIIHVVRDSAATCWSIYKTYFSNSNLGFCYDLNDIVTLYKEYEKIMNFWCADKRGAIRTINYETFTADTEKQIRSLIDHLGLDWDVSCLEPHLNSGSVHTASMVQVRKPIYKNSSQDWKKYEPKLRKYFAGLTI